MVMCARRHIFFLLVRLLILSQKLLRGNVIAWLWLSTLHIATSVVKPGGIKEMTQERQSLLALQSTVHSCLDEICYLIGAIDKAEEGESIHGGDTRCGATLPAAAHLYTRPMHHCLGSI